MELAKEQSKPMGRALPRGVYETRGKYRSIIWAKKSGQQRAVGIYPSVNEAVYRRNVAMNGHHWGGKELDPTNQWGFIYLITNLDNNRKYIGRKQFRLWNGPIGGYKETNPNDAEWFDETLWKPNAWEFYTGSSNELNNDIHHSEIYNFSYEVLSTHDDALQLDMEERFEMINRNVLDSLMDGDYEYYNKSIGGIIFRPPFLKADQRDKKGKTLEAVKRYYLKPKICSNCVEIIPFPGNTKCGCGE